MSAVHTPLRSALAYLAAGVLLLAAAATSSAQSEPPAPDSPLVSLDRELQRLAARLRPSVAEITVVRLLATPDGAPRREAVVLSGFVWSADGRVVSLGRVFESAAEVYVRVGTIHRRAKILGVDAHTALTLLALPLGPAETLPVAPRDAAARPQPGAFVLAFGNRYGLRGSVAFGLVAGAGRSIEADGERLQGLLQLSVPIGPGDPGGPVVDARGTVIAVTGGAFAPDPLRTLAARLQHALSALLGRLARNADRPSPATRPETLLAGGSDSTAYALPMSAVEPIIERLARAAREPHPWLGVQVIGLDPELARELGAPSERGVFVLRVLPGGPAERAGIRAHDVIERIGELEVVDAHALKRWVAAQSVGRRVAVRVRRGEEHRDLEVELRPR
ncbi:MAG: PDZ domain-containing protein [Planctomycetota bacterium]|nr:MAG: PDZ domain-containing protein [Planctomycetota bacterium]